MIRITAKRDGFRRCGVAHTTAGKEWPDDAWSKEQLACLEADHMLVVQRADDAKTGAESSASEPAAGATQPTSRKAAKGNKAKTQDEDSAETGNADAKAAEGDAQ